MAHYSIVDIFTDHEIKDSESFKAKYPSGVTCSCNSADIPTFLEFVEHCRMQSHKEYVSSTYLKEILKQDDIIRKYEKIIQELKNKIRENTLSARRHLWL